MNIREDLDSFDCKTDYINCYCSAKENFQLVLKTFPVIITAINNVYKYSKHSGAPNFCNFVYLKAYGKR